MTTSCERVPNGHIFEASKFYKTKRKPEISKNETPTFELFKSWGWSPR